ncbi:MAG TPA: tyrosine-type recombinase/integrase [Acidimicrobiales bacterium]|nr:tyrosine-type recombinase/integrase [Acidimicrobiales bacterium]
MPTHNPHYRAGELAEHVSGYHAHLLKLGYSRSAANKHRQLVTHLGRWLEREGITTSELSVSVTEGFFRARRARGVANLRTSRSLSPLIDYLVLDGALDPVGPIQPSDPGEIFLDRYRRFLREERGLVEGTIRFYVHIAGLLVSERRRGDEVDWSLRASDVTSFATRTCNGRSLSSIRQVISALRSVLRFLALEGVAEVSLHHAVLSVAGRSASLPRGISDRDLEALVAASDGESAIEQRDRAIVFLLCRLGLRGGEVVGLHLDDVDWRTGEIVVTGKGGRRDRLPLPDDVGVALANYVKVRPHVEDRAVFLRQCAPLRALADTGSIRSVLERACARAGITYVNPHRLRHTLATSMLRAGVSLRDIGQVLGHQSTAVTAVYAKVDVAALRCVARRWPEVRS